MDADHATFPDPFGTENPWNPWIFLWFFLHFPESIVGSFGCPVSRRAYSGRFKWSSSSFTSSSKITWRFCPQVVHLNFAACWYIEYAVFTISYYFIYGEISKFLYPDSDEKHIQCVFTRTPPYKFNCSNKPKNMGKNMWMTNFHQNLAHVAGARLFWLKLLELLETLIITICMDALFGLTTQTYVEGPHPTQETAPLRFYVRWTTGNCLLLGQLSSADLARIYRYV